MSEDILTRPLPPAGERLAWGPHPSQFGELRRPAGEGLHACVVLLHGGFWRARYGLGYFRHAADALAAEGYVALNLEYRRLGEAGWPEMADDVRRGVEIARTLDGVDPDRVVLLGHSAGGQLALWAATQVRVRGVVALAPVSDLAQASRLALSGGVTDELMGGAPDKRPERYREASPRELLPLGVPQWLVHGTEDDCVPYPMSVDYARAAGDAGDRVRLVTLEGDGHYEPVDPSSEAWPRVLASLREALG